MADETSRAADASEALAARTKSRTLDFSNVEFLDQSLSNPRNALRSKLKELDELPDSIRVRRIVILTDLVDETGRGLDVTWSDVEGEESHDTLDSVVAILMRVQNALISSSE